MPGLLTATQYAKQRGVSVALISRYRQNGMPSSGTGKRGDPYKYDPAICDAWIDERGLGGKPGRPRRVDQIRGGVARRKKAGDERARSRISEGDEPDPKLSKLESLRAQLEAKLEAGQVLTDREREYLGDLVEYTKQRRDEAAAAKIELDNQLKARKLVLVAEMLEVLAVPFAKIRAAGENMARRDCECHEVLEDALREAVELVAAWSDAA